MQDRKEEEKEKEGKKDIRGFYFLIMQSLFSNYIVASIRLFILFARSIVYIR